MASDLQEHLAAKIAGLKHSTPTTRRAVYDKARAALQSEVRAAAPFMPVQTVVARRRELENAIIAVEKIAARSDPPVSVPKPPPSAPERGPLPRLPSASLDVELESHAEAAAETMPPEPLQPDPLPPSDLPPTASPPPPGPQAPLDLPPTPSPSPPDWPARHAAALDSAPAAAVREFAPPRPEKKIAGMRGRSFAIYVAAAVIVIGIAVIAAMFAEFAIDQLQGRDSSSQLHAASMPPAGMELIQGAGFNAAAQDALKQGNALLARGEYDRAIAAFDDAIRLDPGQSAAFGSRAFAHWSKGGMEAAIQDYGRALRIEPGNLAYRLNRAIANNRVGEYQRAIADLDEVIRIEPANFDALSSRCRAHVLFNHLQEAATDCSEALKLRPKDLNALDSRGLVFLRLGRLERAIGDFDAALRIDPRRASSLYGRGLAKLGRGDRAGGNDDVAAARAISPDIQATFARYGIR